MKIEETRNQHADLVESLAIARQGGKEPIVFVTRDADRLWEASLIATDQFTDDALTGALVAVVTTIDCDGVGDANAAVRHLSSKALWVVQLDLEGLTWGEGAAEWLDKGGTPQELLNLAVDAFRDALGADDVARLLGPNPGDFLASTPRDLVRLRTGFPTLDQATRGGIPTGIVTTIMGAPHVGKTALATQIGIRAAEGGFLVVVVLKDEGRLAGCIRLGQQMGLDRYRLEEQNPEELARFARALTDRDIRVPDPDHEDCSLENLITEAEKHAHGRNVLLIVDALQNVLSTEADEKDSLREAVGAKMALMEDFAKRGGMVIALSEMNRSAYRNKDAAENIRALAGGAESRSIEYKSRLILSLSGDAEEIVTVSVEKNSPGGKRPTINLKFDRTSATFTEIDRDTAEALRDEHAAEEEAQKAAQVWEKIKKALHRKMELNATALKRAVGGRAERFIEVRDEKVEEGKLLVREDGQGKFYRLADS
jgi:KaiC/GvpD/RAD55 family RecA-like ATPase